MAIFRKIHTTFWSDGFISDLSNDQKLFYIYLLTNERTTQCGIYEITKKQIAFDLGYSIDTVSKHIKYFIAAKRILYNEETHEVALKNWIKYNDNTSPKVQSCINKELTRVKDKRLIQYVYSNDTVSIQYAYSTDTETQEEQEQEKKEEQETCLTFDEFWELYDKKVGKAKLIKKWSKISEQDRAKIKTHVEAYKLSRPDKQYRKDPETYLNNKSWNDEIIDNNGNTRFKNTTASGSSYESPANADIFCGIKKD